MKHGLLNHLSKLTLEHAKNSPSIEKRILQVERAGPLQRSGIGSSGTTSSTVIANSQHLFMVSGINRAYISPYDKLGLQSPLKYLAG
jgi:hypothetical protein